MNLVEKIQSDRIAMTEDSMRWGSKTPLAKGPANFDDHEKVDKVDGCDADCVDGDVEHTDVAIIIMMPMGIMRMTEIT